MLWVRGRGPAGKAAVHSPPVTGWEQSTYNMLGTIIYLGKTKTKHLRLGLLVLPPSSKWDRRGAVFVKYLHYVPDLSLAVGDGRGRYWAGVGAPLPIRDLFV